jgi:hypothetical protein
MTLLQLDYTATAQDSVGQLARRRGRGVHIWTSAFAPLLRWDRLIATPEKDIGHAMPPFGGFLHKKPKWPAFSPDKITGLNSEDTSIS